MGCYESHKKVPLIKNIVEQISVCIKNSHGSIQRQMHVQKVYAKIDKSKRISIPAVRDDYSTPDECLNAKPDILKKPNNVE